MERAGRVFSWIMVVEFAVLALRCWFASSGPLVVVRVEDFSILQRELFVLGPAIRILFGSEVRWLQLLKRYDAVEDLSPIVHGGVEFSRRHRR